MFQIFVMVHQPKTCNSILLNVVHQFLLASLLFFTLFLIFSNKELVQIVEI